MICSPLIQSRDDEMAGQKVNLDAMIPRVDLDVNSETASDQTNPGKELYLNQLTAEGRLASLRKPSFQRETAAWTPEIVAEFIRSFVDNDVIPGMIMWQSPRDGTIFVIDGAHRLSALVAWINDDYGDRSISQEFYGYEIGDAQLAAAKRTRSLVEELVGSYARLKSYSKAPDAAPSEKDLKRSRNLSNVPAYLQWIPGDAKAAETSFLRINSTAAPINEVERALISMRRKPAGMAVRAIVRAGTGHKFWLHFTEDKQRKIETLASRVYNETISPIAEYPVHAMDWPASGRGYSVDSQKTILDLVSFIAPQQVSGKGRALDKLPDDESGDDTIKCLEAVAKATERVFGRHAGSLALHPGVYCYGPTGQFVPKAFIGAIGFAQHLEQTNSFHKFTDHRKAFEDFLVSNRHYIQAVGKAQGSGGRRGIPAVVELYKHVFAEIAAGKNEQTIKQEISKNEAISFLQHASQDEDASEKDAGKFSNTDKASVLLKESLDAEQRCPECGARRYVKNLSKDHKIRRADGGKTNATNLQFTHPFCNTGYKEKKARLDEERDLIQRWNPELNTQHRTTG